MNDESKSIGIMEMFIIAMALILLIVLGMMFLDAFVFGYNWIA